VLYQAALLQFLQIYHKITDSPLPQTKKTKHQKTKKKFQKLTINLINEIENEARLDMGGVTF
jgi:hypothetical protein